MIYPSCDLTIILLPVAACMLIFLRLRGMGTGVPGAPLSFVMR